jgi:hypothetical protein
MKLKVATAIIALAITTTSAGAAEAYLDKLDKTLNNWWSALDSVCRGEPGGSEASNLACDRRVTIPRQSRGP